MLLLLAAPAQAADPPDDAKTFFAEGRRLRLAGDCAGAVVQFELARKAFPEGLGSLRNIAECQEEMGQTASARRSWWSLRREAMARNEERYDGWKEDAERAHGRLEAAVPKVVIALEGDTTGVAVTLDGRAVKTDLLGEPLERDPGVHHLVVRRGERVLHESDVKLRPAQTETVRVRLPAAQAEPIDPTQPIPEPSGVSGLAVGGWIGVGLGAASFIGAGIAAGVRQGALSDLETQCPTYDTGVCAAGSDADAIASTQDRGTAAATATNALLIVGGVTAAVGVSLLVVDLTSEDEPPDEVGLVVGPTGLWLRGAFY